MRSWSGATPASPISLAARCTPWIPPPMINHSMLIEPAFAGRSSCSLIADGELGERVRQLRPILAITGGKLLVEQARVEASAQRCLVYLLTDEDELLGAVAEAGVPVRLLVRANCNTAIRVGQTAVFGIAFILAARWLSRPSHFICSPKRRFSAPRSSAGFTGVTRRAWPGATASCRRRAALSRTACANAPSRRPRRCRLGIRIHRRAISPEIWQHGGASPATVNWCHGLC
jgi:hypothetical protein